MVKLYFLRNDDFQLSLFSFRNRFQFFDLLDEVRLLIVELLVVLTVVVELGQEVDQLVLISKQDVQNGFRLVGIGDEHLKVKSDVKI